MNNNDPMPLLVIAGPTAVGKSALALGLSHRFPIEIISADARQVYRGLDIGTAKSTADEQAQCVHHCIDIRDPNESYSASEYMHDARTAIDAVPPGTLPVMVGGSGLYISAATDGLSVDAVAPDEAVRSTLNARLENEGKERLFAELQKLDPTAAARYVDQNPRRVLRALEYIHITGKTFSSSWDAPRVALARTVIYIVVTAERDVLNKRIDERCEFMWNNGLLQETRIVLQRGVAESAQSLSTVGYREAISYISGKVSETQTISDMKIATKQYAKRQRTWFRREERYIWLQQPSVDDVISLLKNDHSFSRIVDL